MKDLPECKIGISMTSSPQLIPYQDNATCVSNSYIRGADE